MSRCSTTTTTVGNAYSIGGHTLQCREPVEHILWRHDHTFDAPNGGTLEVPVFDEELGSLRARIIRKNTTRPLLIRQNVWGSWSWICRICDSRAGVSESSGEYVRYNTSTSRALHESALTDALDHYRQEH